MKLLACLLSTLLTAAALPSLAAQQPAPATPKRPMTFADLMAMKRVSDPQISPSGKWVLFSVTDVSLEKNTKTNHLWAVPLDGKSPEHQATHGTGESNGRLSPDGKWVMYTANTPEGKSEIFIAPWDDASGGIGAGHAVTSLATEADNAIWAPDSQHLLFTSDVYPECESHAPLGPQRNEEEAQCNARKLSAEAKSPVKALLFTHLLYRHWDHYIGNRRSHIFYGSIDGSAPEDLTPASVIGDHVAPTFSLGGPLGYAISPDGKEIAYVVNLDKVPAESTNNDIFTLEVGTEPNTAKKVSTSPGSDDGPQYSPDGKYLAWRSQARNGYESDKFNLVVMNRANGAISNLTSHFYNWVDEFAWNPNSNNIFFASANHGEEEVFVASLEKAPLDVLWSEAADDEHRQQNAEYGSLIPSPDGARLVAAKMSVGSPAYLVALELANAKGSGAKLTHADNGSLILQYGSRMALGDISAKLVPEVRLTSTNEPLLDSLDLPPMDSFWFPGANGTKVQGFLLKPPNFDPSKKYPVKFLMHGGPQTAWGDSWSYRWNWELFAADGYVVIGINRRGSTGYGQKFLEEVSGDWGGRPYIDLMKGLDFAEAKYPFIDKNRECALGASYGGYMADWVLTHTNRFKCIVTHDGMSDPAAAFGATEELWFPEWEFRPLASNSPDAVVEQAKPSHPWDFYGKPEMDDPYIKWSPMRFIKDAHTPTLIVHSQRDYRLDVSQGFELFTALQLLHVPSEMLYFPDEGHWVLKPQNSQLWNQTVSDWCDRWLGMNKYAATGPEPNPAAAK